MEVKRLIVSLTRGREVIRALVSDLPPEQFRWKPAPDKWSILEVLCHLGDEEVDDFRTRLDLTLHRPGAAWPPIHPSAWAVERRYNEQDPAVALRRVLEERERSLAWLATLSDPDWEKGYQHPQAGLIRAGDLALSWAAHDLLHIRQIDRLHYHWLEQEGQPYSPDYAGGWSPGG
jgi:hypothetical protein